MSATTLRTAIASANAVDPPIPTEVQPTRLDEAFRKDPYPVLKRLGDAEPTYFRGGADASQQ